MGLGWRELSVVRSGRIRCLKSYKWTRSGARVSVHRETMLVVVPLSPAMVPWEG